jgi:hypothetical protein
MIKYNVKKIENTNTMATTLSTTCKKQTTAENRFTRFLETYDSCFTETMLKCFMNIKPVGYVNGELISQATIEENEYTMSVQISDNTYIISIEFKHDENTTHYKSLANTSVSNITKDNDNNETASDNIKDFTDSADDNKTPAELKSEINKKYGVNAVYYDTDSILCNAEKQNVYVIHDKATDPTSQPCHIKAYYDGKELTVPYSEYKCVKYAVEYIHSLYINRVVSYDTVFILKCGSQAKEYTIHTLMNIPDLLQYNIDDINVGLKTDFYKKVREGVERLCNLIDYKHVCVVGFKYTAHTFDYAITKSKYPDSYNFKRGNNNWIQKPSEIARFLYYHTFTHEIMLKYWHTI